MKKLIAIELLIVGIFFSGCQFICLNYHGRFVEEQYRISALDREFHESVWADDYLILAYEYRRFSNNIQFSGTIELTSMIKNGFQTIENLFVRVHCINSTGEIIHTAQLFASNYREHIKQWSFRKNIAIPYETVALTFSYSGQAMDTSDEDGNGSFYFSNMPF